jgi:hypothetical protein
VAIDKEMPVKKINHDIIFLKNKYLKINMQFPNSLTSLETFYEYLKETLIQEIPEYKGL